MFRERIHSRARQGERLTDDEISFITNGSEDLAGTGSGSFTPAPSSSSDRVQILPSKVSGLQLPTKLSGNPPTRSPQTMLKM